MHHTQRALCVLLATASWFGCAKDSADDTAVDTSPPVFVDADEDGVPADEDCDDTNPDLGAQAEDADCDGLRISEDCDDTDPNANAIAEDADCDGTPTADDCDDANPDLNTRDADGDGVTSCDGDCDDQAPSIHPGASDGLIADRNCDGVVDATGSLAQADTKILGLFESDYAGVEVAAGGDLNGDGRMDFLVAAPYEDASGLGAGAVYVFLGKPGWLASTVKLDDADYRFLGEAEADNAGTALAGVGDVDGDGRDDFVVGARYQAAGGPYAGAAYLIYGSSLGPDTTQSLSEAGIKFVGERFHDNAGAAVSAAGDVDGDGLADLMVGAYRNDTQAEDAGAAYLFLGASLGAASVVDVGDADFVLVGTDQDTNAGYSLAPAGDVDGDGLGDLLVGARYDAEGGLYAGAAYVVFGAALKNPGVVLLEEVGCKMVGEEISDYAGIAVGTAGDLDRDGLADVLVGAPGVDLNGLDAGAVYGVWGSQLAGCTTMDLSEAGFRILGESPGDSVGQAVASLEDIDGDRSPEILLGVDGQDAGAAEAGAVYLLSGSRFVETGVLALDDADFRILGEADGDGAGLSVAAVGDWNGDLRADLLVGAAGDDTSAINAGAAYLISGK